MKWSNVYCSVYIYTDGKSDPFLFGFMWYLIRGGSGKKKPNGNWANRGWFTLRFATLSYILILAGQSPFYLLLKSIILGP